MCTLILGRDVVSPGSVLVAANRDEDPARPSDPPGVLRQHPLLIGGRDRRAGGTWLAVREGRALVAVLNRRAVPDDPAVTRRSRGALVLDVAGVAEAFPTPLDRAAETDVSLAGLRAISGEGLAYAAICRAFAAVTTDRFAACTLLFAAPEACWMLTVETATPPRFDPVLPGWHVLTHAGLDDLREPRTARLVRELEDFRPGSAEVAERRVDDLLRLHGEGDAPPVCLHAGRMVTVSSSSVWLAPGEVRYRHAEGRPCEHPYGDQSHLLRTGAEEKR